MLTYDILTNKGSRLIGYLYALTKISPTAKKSALLASAVDATYRTTLLFLARNVVGLNCKNDRRILYSAYRHYWDGRSVLRGC